MPEYKKNTVYLPKFSKPPFLENQSESPEKKSTGARGFMQINQPSERSNQHYVHTIKNTTGMNMIKSEINKESDTNSFWSQRGHFDPKARIWD